jgi:hypothetical protein
MNKKAILASALLVFFLASFVSVIADELSEVTDASDVQEADVQQSLNVIRPISALIGYVENEEDAAHVRMWIGKVKTIPLSTEIMKQAREIRETYKDDLETMKEKLKELAQDYKKELSEIDSYQGLLVIGKGKDHETYRLLSKEVSNDTLTFYVLEKNVVSETAPQKKGFFYGLGKRLGFVKKQIVVQANTSDLNVLGEITLNKEAFDSITLWKGVLELDSGKYEGAWDVNVFSAGNIWWPKPWWGNSLEVKEKVKVKQQLGEVEDSEED